MFGNIVQGLLKVPENDILQQISNVSLPGFVFQLLSGFLSFLTVKRTSHKTAKAMAMSRPEADQVK
jgi:hypothetical protein